MSDCHHSNGGVNRALAMADQRKTGRLLRVLILSSTLSKSADYSLQLVVPLVVLSSTDSTAAAILVIALRGVAYGVSPLVGSLVDRFDRRAVFIGSQVLQALCVLIVLLSLTSLLGTSIALLVSGLGSVAASISGQFVLIPALVKPEDRETAVARMTSSIELAKVGGFVGGGLLFTVMGGQTSVAAVAALYVLAALLALVLPQVPAGQTRSSVWADLIIGFSWLKKPEIGWLVASTALSNLALGALATVLVTVMASRSVPTLTISCCLALGLLTGALGARLSPFLLPTKSLVVRLLVSQILGLATFAAITLPDPIWLWVAGFCANSFVLGASNVVSITFRQDAIPLDVAGRVNSVIRMFIAGSVPLSGLIYAAASRWDIWLWSPALALEVIAVGVWFWFALRSDQGRYDRSC